MSIIKLINIVEVLVSRVVEELFISIKGYIKVISSKLVAIIILRIAFIKSISKVNLIDRESFFRN